MGVYKHGIGYRADFTKCGYRHKSPVLDTEAEAEDWETVRRGEIAAKIWQPTGAASVEQPTVAQILRWYGKVHTLNFVSEPHREISRINKICEFSIGDVLLDQLNNKILLTFMRQRRAMVRIVNGKEKLISRKTIQEDLNMMHKAIAAAIFEEEVETSGVIYKITINANPVDTRNLLKHSGIENDAVQRKDISPDIQEALVKAAKGYNNEVYNFIRLAIATGQRRGELLEQDWSKVHLTNKYMTSKNKAPKIKPELKTREVPLSPTARTVLQEMKQKKSGLLFPMLAKELDRINDAIKEICTANSLPHITPHLFRHTCETNNQRLGVIEDKRKLLLGRTIEGSAGIYSHVKPREFADEFV